MRVTLEMLQNKVDYINEATGSPMEPYTRTSENELKANVGNYHLSQSYGGIALARMVKGGGVTMPTHSGHITKRELCHQLDGFIAALRAMK